MSLFVDDKDFDIISRLIPQQSKVIDIEIEKATKIILSFCHIGIDRTMNKYN